MTKNSKDESWFSRLGVFEYNGLGATNGDIESYLKKGLKYYRYK
jgi:hypothetical protein